MRFGAASVLSISFAVALGACAANSPKESASSAGGGSAASSSGGSRSSGGSSSTGDATGGKTTTTVASSGGNGTSGGGSQGGGGGGSVSGGTGSGGAAATGGSGAGQGSGGVTAAGGSTSGSSGGGGSCTDDPPPNQTPTCSEWVGYNVCTQDWFKTYCNRSCGRCSGGGPSGAGGAPGGGAGGGPAPATGGAAGRGGATSGGAGAGGTNGGQGGSATSGGGAAGPGSTNPGITGSTSTGWASRYWDCCKPSCSWTTNVPACQKDGTTRISDKNAQSACSGGSAFECYDFSPWYDASTNMSYGFAAHAGACGTCYMLQFTGGTNNAGNNPGAAALKGQQMIVQAINIGNISNDQFDLLIPGGGVGQLNACNTQWGGSVDLGSTYGGLLSECKDDTTCMKQKCQSVYGSMPALLAGCNWFTGWFGSADNPSLVYKQVSCPSQITSKSGIGG